MESPHASGTRRRPRRPGCRRSRSRGRARARQRRSAGRGRAPRSAAARPRSRCRGPIRRPVDSAPRRAALHRIEKRAEAERIFVARYHSPPGRDRLGVLPLARGHRHEARDPRRDRPRTRWCSSTWASPASGPEAARKRSPPAWRPGEGPRIRRRPSAPTTFCTRAFRPASPTSCRTSRSRRARPALASPAARRARAGGSREGCSREAPLRACAPAAQAPGPRSTRVRRRRPACARRPEARIAAAVVRLDKDRPARHSHRLGRSHAATRRRKLCAFISASCSSGSPRPSPVRSRRASVSFDSPERESPTTILGREASRILARLEA